MTTDLHRSLTALAEAAPRSAPPTGDLLRRARRRRALRAATTTAVGALAVAGVAAGALALGGAREVPSAATPAPTSPRVGAHPSCGGAGPDHPRATGGVSVGLAGGGTGVAWSPVPLTVDLAREGEAATRWRALGPAEVAVLRDGVVVATGVVPVPASPGGSAIFSWGDEAVTGHPVDLVPCDGELALGEYEVVATVTLVERATDDGAGGPGSAEPARLRLTTDPVPLSVVDLGPRVDLGE